MSGVAQETPRCLATHSSLTPYVPVLKCHSYALPGRRRPLPKPHPNSSLHAGPFKAMKTQTGHNAALLGSRASRSTHTSHTTPSSGSRSWGGGGRCLPSLSGMQHLSEAADSLHRGSSSEPLDAENDLSASSQFFPGWYITSPIVERG